MEMSMQMNLNIDKMVSMPYKIRCGEKGYKPNNISCNPNEIAMQKKKINFYEILSLGSKSAGFDEIKKAYRRMVLQYHPDVCPPTAKEESTKRFVELQKAYETLSDPIAREMYDYELGLVNSVGFQFMGVCREDRRSKFPKEIWEHQLRGLKKHSHDRLGRKGRKTDN